MQKSPLILSAFPDALDPELLPVPQPLLHELPVFICAPVPPFKIQKSENYLTSERLAHNLIKKKMPQIMSLESTSIGAEEFESFFKYLGVQSLKEISFPMLVTTSINTPESIFQPSVVELHCG